MFLSKRIYPLFILTLVAGLFASCGEGDVHEINNHNAMLAASPESQKITANGTASVTFSLSFISEMSGQAEDISKYTGTLSFTATGGTVSPTSATTDASGSITVVFTATDPDNFEGGTVTGVVKKVQENVKDGLFQQGDLATATATILPADAIDKAEGLDDNTYVVKVKGGEAKTFPLSQQDSRWYVGRSYTDRTKEAIKVELMDEDPTQSTMGWSMAELPTAIANKLTIINQEFYQKYPWAAVKFGTMRTNTEVSAHVGEGGNVKLDGSSQIWLKEETGTKGYTGLYRFLFVFEFTNETWDSSTQTMIPGDEYTIYGNAIVEQDFPTLNYFSVVPTADWVQVGKSVAVDVDWTDGADFDINKVKLVGQTLGYSSSEDTDEGYFQWNPASSTLTSLKTSGNGTVYLKFRYEGTDMGTTCQLATGPGWDFTSFSFDPARLVMDKYDVLPLYIGDYAPKSVGSWDWAAIEIDPDSNPNGAFYYDYGTHKIYNFSGKAGQTYNLRFRIRSNHSVTAPLEVYVVEQKPNSFTITYEHNNDYINDTNTHGVCNYPMGLRLGVITSPADCYWSWADVELANDYDGFSFNGTGGRDDHPKLERTKSNPSGGTEYGTQIIFRLKYDHSVTSTIYIDHN